MSNRHIKQKTRLNIPNLQTRLQQENQILFLKCHSPKKEHKEIEDKYRENIRKINEEIEELFSGF